MADVCFVCLQSGGELMFGRCGCTHRAVHATCLETLILSTSSHATCCAICTKSYESVEIIRKKRMRKVSLEVIATTSFAVFCFFGALTELYIYLQDRQLIWCLCLSAGSFVLFIAFVAFSVKRHKGVGCYENKTVHVHVHPLEVSI